MTENEALRILGDTTLCSPLGQAAFVGIEAIKKLKLYREIGTVEEIKRMQRYSTLAKKHGTIGQVIDSCAEYEAIGTVEECRSARERQRKAIPEANTNFYRCPNCGEIRSIRQKHNYCHDCGQAFGWRK